MTSRDVSAYCIVVVAIHTKIVANVTPAVTNLTFTRDVAQKPDAAGGSVTQFLSNFM